MNLRTLSILLSLGAATPAMAHGTVGYGVGFGWGPAFVAPPQPSMMFVNNQYFDLSVSGIEDLCRAQPGLCDTPALQGDLASLQRERAVGYTLAFLGFGVAVGGPLISALHSCEGTNRACNPNWNVVTAS